MDIKEAVGRAKSYVADLYQSEGATNFGLEEIRKNGSHWEVTIGFSRPWDVTYTGVGVLTRQSQYKRDYKIIRLDEDGAFEEMINKTG